MTTQKQTQKGLTLIEILIVLAIIGTLMAVITPRLQRLFGQSKARQTNMVIDNLVNDLSMYLNDCYEAPSSAQDLLTKPSSCDNWVGPYTTEKGLKDGWKQDLQISGQGTKVTIKSLGADKTPSGDDITKEVEL